METGVPTLNLRLLLRRLNTEFDAVARGLGDYAAVTLAAAPPQLGFWRKLQSQRNHKSSGD